MYLVSHRWLYGALRTSLARTSPPNRPPLHTHCAERRASIVCYRCKEGGQSPTKGILSTPAFPAHYSRIYHIFSKNIPLFSKTQKPGKQTLKTTPKTWILNPRTSFVLEKSGMCFRKKKVFEVHYLTFTSTRLVVDPTVFFFEGFFPIKVGQELVELAGWPAPTHSTRSPPTPLTSHPIHPLLSYHSRTPFPTTATSNAVNPIAPVAFIVMKSNSKLSLQ